MVVPPAVSGTGMSLEGAVGADSRERSDYFELVFQCAPIGMGLVNLDGTILSANRALCAFVGYTQAELLSRAVMDITTPDDVAFTREELEGLVLHGVRTASYEKRYRHKLGHDIWGAVSVHVHRDENGEPLFFIAHIQDITERKRAEAELRENEEKFRIAFENAPMGMSIIGPTGQYLAVNPALCRMFGYSPDDLLSGTINRITHPDDIERGNAWIRKMISGDTSEPEFEKRYIHKDGHIVWGLVRAEWVRHPDGTAKMSVVHILDITERKRAEQELLNREHLLREAHEIASMGHWQRELSDSSITWADGIYRLLEYTPGTVVPSDELLLSRVHPDDRHLVAEADGLAIEQQEPTDIVHRLEMPDARIKYVRRITRTESGTSGQALRITGILQDITSIHQAEEARAVLEAQLHQAQKMEAVGHLAGGIAHDFNNLLTVMGGNASLALLDSERSTGSSEPIQEILKSVKSAAELTRQLLSFSRKQVIVPKVINLNELVQHSSSMLRRLLGEDLEFSTCLDPSLGQVKLDPVQAEQILINLAVNARDAMADGGKLTIETANVVLGDEYCRNHAGAQAGRFVRLVVSDTGIGMPADTLRRIFEPFFTTKEQGRGTGLGLAMVYGAIHQNGGTIDVHSEPGHGTTFEMYLPRVDESAEGIQPSTNVRSTSGSEVIVLVEDDDHVRMLGARILERHGYIVHAFGSARDALAASTTLAMHVDLVITDVIMPGMNGKAFSEKIRELYPEVKVLFTSGYTYDIIAQHGVLDQEVQFLEKPYTLSGLATRVRELLDQAS